MQHTDANPLRRARLAVVSALLLVLTLGATHAQEETYEDPQGRFTVPIPTNWSAETVDDRVRLTPPDGDVEVHLTVIEGTDLEAAIEAAWDRVDPSFDAEVRQRQEPPAQGQVEEVLGHDYDVGSERLAQAIARLRDGQVHVLLVRGGLTTIQQRASQFNVIQSGWTLAGTEETDLSGQEPAALEGEALATFERYVADALPRYEVPGASVVVVQDGDVAYRGGFGVRDRESGAPVTPSTQMMIGSVTKTLTTMMMGTVVDDGAMAWDTPVREVMPSFAVADEELSERITMENLVCACTGVPRRDFELIFNAESQTAEDVVRSLADFEFFTDFGEAFQYSNQLVATGGYAAALAAGDASEAGADDALLERYVAEMRDRILGPMGMVGASFSFEEAAENPYLATPYGLSAGFQEVALPLSAERFVEALAPAGGLFADANAMGTYLRTLLADGVAPGGTRVISETNLHATWEPQVSVSSDADYGLGWIVERNDGLRVLSHGGNTFGYTAELAIVPEADLGIAVLANRRAANAFAQGVRARLLEVVYDQPAEADENAQFQFQQQKQSLQEQADELEPAADEDAVQPLLGSYANHALGEMTLARDDGRFTLDAGSFVTELRPRTDDDGEVEAYVMVDPPLPGLPLRVVDGEDEDGGGARLRLGEGATEYLFEPIE